MWSCRGIQASLSPNKPNELNLCQPPLSDMPWGERQDGGRLVAMGQAPVQVPLPQTAVPRVHARELMAGPERFLVELGNGASCDGR